MRFRSGSVRKRPEEKKLEVCLRILLQKRTGSHGTLNNSRRARRGSQGRQKKKKKGKTLSREWSVVVSRARSYPPSSHPIPMAGCRVWLAVLCKEGPPASLNGEFMGIRDILVVSFIPESSSNGPESPISIFSARKFVRDSASGDVGPTCSA